MCVDGKYFLHVYFGNAPCSFKNCQVIVWGVFSTEITSELTTELYGKPTLCGQLLRCVWRVFWLRKLKHWKYNVQTLQNTEIHVAKNASNTRGKLIQKKHVLFLQHRSFSVKFYAAHLGPWAHTLAKIIYQFLGPVVAFHTGFPFTIWVLLKK